MIITTAFLLLLTSACTSTPKYEQIQGGTWEARSLIKDKKNSKTYLVNIDFIALKPDSLRADVTTPIGVHVISTAQTGKKMSYIVPQRKVYYSGVVSNQVFSELISYPLDSGLLINILFEQPITKKGWACKNDEKNQLLECENKAQGLKVEWTQRRGVEKTVEISHATFEMQLQFHSFKQKSDFNEKTFQIDQPKGFKKL